MVAATTNPVILIVRPGRPTPAAHRRTTGCPFSRDYTVTVDPDVVTASRRMRALAETGHSVALILADRASNGDRASR